MANYTGEECLSCGRKFESNDDIVVCPECGTPYHRECYLKEGECINHELHESGGCWSESKKSDECGGEVRCIRCGAENSSDKLFCEKCGTPLMKNTEENVPFNNVNGENGDPNPRFNPNMNAYNGAPPYGAFGQQMVFDKNSEIDGIKLDDYAKYIGPNPVGFLTNFIKFSKLGGKISFNIGAVFFPSLYFMFRKMKGIGTALLILCAVLNVPGIIEVLASGTMGVKFNLPIDIKSSNFMMLSSVSSYVLMIISIAAGLFANYIYFKKAKKDINQIRGKTDADEETVKSKISAKGGTSIGLGILSFIAGKAIEIGIVFGLTKII